MGALKSPRVAPRPCGDEYCQNWFVPSQPTQRFCSDRCRARKASRDKYRARTGSKGYLPPPPERRPSPPRVALDVRRCLVCGVRLAATRAHNARYCSARCKERQRNWGGNAPPELAAPRTWHWEAIRPLLAAPDGASAAQIAQALYGATDSYALYAARGLMWKLARATGRYAYAGGPWVASAGLGRYKLAPRGREAA